MRVEQAGHERSTLNPSPLLSQMEWGSEGVAQELHWFVHGAIPAGSLVLLEGRKEVGKSSVSTALAAAVTGGPPFPHYVGPRRGRVLWCGAEDPWEEVIVPRILAAGGDIQRVGRLLPVDNRGERRRPLLPDDLPLIAHCLNEREVNLVVLDPFISLAGPEIDVRIEQQARLYLEPLAALMAEYRAVCVMTRHIRKGRAGDTREAGLGSVAIGNLARSILRCDEHPHAPGQYVLSVVALNYAQKMKTQVYSFRDGQNGHPQVVWQGQSDLAADVIAEGRGDEAERGEWLDADRLLISVIGSGWVRVNVLVTEGERGGISSRMLRRAKERLRIPSRRVQLGKEAYWEWGPPLHGWPSHLSDMDQTEVEGGGHAHARAPRGGGAPKNPRKRGRKGQGAKAPTRAHAPPQGAGRNGEEVKNASD